MKVQKTQFAGYDCVKLANQELALWLTVSAGPRIIGLSLTHGDNLLVVLPDATTRTPAGRVYSLRGGHRLWHAPEHPERTYVPDDEPVQFEQASGGVSVTQPVETLTGVEKRITVTLPGSQARAIVDHTLTNRGPSAVTLAPWAITQLKPGGFAILPQATSETGLLPNRRLALWPYTDINSTHLTWGNRFVFVHAGLLEGRLKIGWANPMGWLAYWIDGTLFVKSAAYQPGATYYDFGSSSECYCDPRFLELETLGPKTTLAPGEKVIHREVWTLYPAVSVLPEEKSVTDWIDQLGIGKNESES